MLVKSAPPTPTITMESGNLEAPTILSTVLCMSDMTPSYDRKKTQPSPPISNINLIDGKIILTVITSRMK